MSSYQKLSAMRSAPRNVSNPMMPLDGMKEYQYSGKPNIDYGSARYKNKFMDSEKKPWNFNATRPKSAPRREFVKESYSRIGGLVKSPVKSRHSRPATAHPSKRNNKPKNHQKLVGDTQVERERTLEHQITKSTIRAVTMAKEIRDLRNMIHSMKNEKDVTTKVILQELESAKKMQSSNLEVIANLNKEKEDLEREIQNLRSLENNIQGKQQQQLRSNKVTKATNLSSKPSSKINVVNSTANTTSKAPAARTISDCKNENPVGSSWADQVRQLYLNENGEICGGDKCDVEPAKKSVKSSSEKDNNTASAMASSIVTKKLSLKPTILGNKELSNTDNNNAINNNNNNNNNKEKLNISVSKSSIHPVAFPAMEGRSVVAHKTISQRRLEQDLAQKKAEENKHLNTRFYV